MFSYDVSWWVAIQMSGCGGDLFTLGLCIAFVPQSLLRKIAVKVCTSKGFIVRCVKFRRKGKTFLVEKILKNKISSETVFSLQRTCCSLFLYDQYICVISLKLIHTLFQTPGIEWDLTSIALSWELGRFWYLSLKPRQELWEVSLSFQWEEGRSGSLTDEKIWETGKDEVIHDCQGSETQKHEKSNQVELGETLPTGAEGIDRSTEPEQKGQEIWKDKTKVYNLCRNEDSLPRTEAVIPELLCCPANYLKSTVLQWLIPIKRYYLCSVFLVPVVEVCDS